MKVLLLFSTGGLGGAERSLSRMALAPGRTIYRLATLGEEGPWSQWVRSRGAEPLVFGKAGHGVVNTTFQPILRLFKYLRRHPVDAVYVCGARACFFLRFLCLMLPGTRLIHGVRWNPDSTSPLDRFFRAMETLTHGLVDGWIVNSAVIGQTLVRRCRIPTSKIFVIHNGLASLPPAVPDHNRRPLEVLTIANLNPRKGHKAYLQVIRQVADAVPVVTFVFVGRDDMDGAFQRAVSEAGLDRFICYKGFQDNVSPWLGRARIFVLPSLWGEGCPTSILEALSHGVPAIAYAIDGIPELVAHNQDGILIPPHDRNRMGKRIIELLQSPGRTEEMGRSGRLKIERAFTLAQCVHKHDRALETVLKQNGYKKKAEYN